jgi:hypothetical protein
MQVTIVTGVWFPSGTHHHIVDSSEANLGQWSFPSSKEASPQS